MAGGTWVDQNKVRPGVYINYSSKPSSLATMGERGIVCIAKQLDWGVDNKVIVITDPNEAFTKLGYDQSSDKMIWFRQLLLGSNRSAGASKVLVWKLASDGAAAATATQAKTVTAAAATATLGDLVVTAKNTGSAGNSLAVSIADGGSSNFIVKTFEGDLEKDSQTVTAITDLTANDYVAFSGSGSLAVADKTFLTGGVDAFSGSIQATAVCKGIRGNDITVVVTPDPDNSDSRCIFYVQTLVSGSVVDTQTLKADAKTVALSGLMANDWVSFTVSGDAFQTSLTLASGANGTVSDTAYSDFMGAMELQTWNILVYGGTDAVIKSALSSYVQRLSNEEGKKVQCVLWNYPSADNECVISVMPQKITDTANHKMNEEEMVCWVAGASAGANVSDSLTYASHPDAVSLDPSLTGQQQIDALNAGQFCFIEEFGAIKNLQDNNTFTSFTATKGKQFRKNRVIRTVFGLCNDIYRTYSQSYIGTTNNDSVGRGLLKSEILELMFKYQGNGALQNVQEDDVTVSAGNDSDSVLIELQCQPVDSIEKIYINITIS